MNTNQMNTGRGYWLAWFLMSIMGYGMGAVLGTAFASRLFPIETSGTANGITLGFVMGATGGYFQWVVLRERVAGAGLWALASALGTSARGAISDRQRSRAAALRGRSSGSVSSTSRSWSKPKAAPG